MPQAHILRAQMYGGYKDEAETATPSQTLSINYYTLNENKSQTILQGKRKIDNTLSKRTVTEMKETNYETKRTCDTCEWNFGSVCAAGVEDENGKSLYGYPMAYMREHYSGKCSHWNISLTAFIEEEKRKAKGRYGS